MGLLILMTVTVYWGIIYGYGIKGWLVKTKAGTAVLRSIFTPIKAAFKNLVSISSIFVPLFK